MTDDKTPKRKKSETLEVRLPHDTKQAFLTACREDGTTASEVVRTSIDEYLEERERPDPQTQTGNVIAMIPKPLRSRKVAAGVAGAVGLAMLSVLPSAADPDFKSAFGRLDRNKDNVISLEEFMPEPGVTDKESSAEDKADVLVTHVERRVQTVTSDRGPPPAPAPSGRPEPKEDAYAFWLPPDEASDGGGGVNEKYVRTIERKEVRIEGDKLPAHDEAMFSPQNMRKHAFDQFDADKDGKIILSEYEARQRAMLTRGFEVLDADGSGALSQAEYLRIGGPVIHPPAGGNAAVGGGVSFEAYGSATSQEKLTAHFGKLDRNRDGQLSLAEYLPQS